MTRLGGIEAGGTKFICTTGTNPDDLTGPARIETSNSDPRQTVREVVRWLKDNGPVAAVGAGCFGPLDLRTGTITTTPKLVWQNFPLRQELESALGVPVAVDTDVNAAALGEHEWGAARGLDTFLYLTVGTGIGGGGMAGGAMLHGKQHPEMGHVLLPRHPEEPAGFDGVCPWHRGCLEGLASGPAMEERWGCPASGLPPNHPAWRITAHYLAAALVGFICTMSPQKIILGGGVMEQQQLFPMIRKQVSTLLNGYLDPPAIVPPEQKWCGVLGALALGAQTANTR